VHIMPSADALEAMVAIIFFFGLPVYVIEGE
jgi:hypothetical protein